MSRTAVVLFNLGGPDGPKAVRPFLKNLFSDRAIIGAPNPIRFLIAELVSRLRQKSAIANYAVMGGGSPLVAETEAQAEALTAALAEKLPGDDIKVFIAMRYWNPLSDETAAAVAAFEPEDIVLLPLYPQYSTTTTGSSLAAWDATYAGGGRRHVVCCYFNQEAFAEAHAAAIIQAWEAAGSPDQVRLLFSAHGLPESIAASGDPYRWQVEQTCAAVVQRLTRRFDWRICYQSRVGPMKWIGPSTVEEIERAATEGLGVIIDPIAFVSEHVETLVELDRDYADVAERVGAAPYIRVRTLGTAPGFVGGLADLVVAALKSPGVRPGAGSCSADLKRCALKTFCEAA
ncbi:MAG TPA: ferrochelatase [Caulobacteraceae bacterium]|jgi:ferrochelatase